MTAIVFDVDDTLYLRRDPYIAAARRLLGEKLPAGEDDLFARSRAVGEEEFRRWVRGELTQEEMEISRARRTFASFGLALSGQEAARFQALYLEEQEKIHLHPAMEAVLAGLSRREDVFLGVLTNGISRHQRGKCALLGLGRFMKDGDILTSEEAGAAKPDPGIFERFAGDHGLRPSDTWMIGDSLASDIRGAAACGWRSVWIPRYGEERDAGEDIPADRIARSDGELAEIVRSLAEYA